MILNSTECISYFIHSLPAVCSNNTKFLLIPTPTSKWISVPFPLLYKQYKSELLRRHTSNSISILLWILARESLISASRTLHAGKRSNLSRRCFCLYLTGRYQIEIEARDGLGSGPHTDTAVIMIEIQSINQHRPVFIMPALYNATVEIPEVSQNHQYKDRSWKEGSRYGFGRDSLVCSGKMLLLKALSFS